MDVNSRFTITKEKANMMLTLKVITDNKTKIQYLSFWSRLYWWRNGFTK